MSRPDFIETASGRSFRPLEPNVGDILLEDIAHALSNQCRFSGHVRTHYSVAEHSVRVSELLESWGCSREIQLWGLLHDATEAYLVDIPSPLKCTPVFEAYRAAEDRLMVAVCRRFGLPIAQPSRVHQADAVLLATEVRDLMPFRPEHWTSIKEKPLAETITPWGHKSAEINFINRYSRVSA